MRPIRKEPKTIIVIEIETQQLQKEPHAIIGKHQAHRRTRHGSNAGQNLPTSNDKADRKNAEQSDRASQTLARSAPHVIVRLLAEPVMEPLAPDQTVGNEPVSHGNIIVHSSPQQSRDDRQAMPARDRVPPVKASTRSGHSRAVPPSKVTGTFEQAGTRGSGRARQASIRKSALCNRCGIERGPALTAGPSQQEPKRRATARRKAPSESTTGRP